MTKLNHGSFRFRPTTIHWQAAHQSVWWFRLWPRFVLIIDLITKLIKNRPRWSKPIKWIHHSPAYLFWRGFWGYYSTAHFPSETTELPSPTTASCNIPYRQSIKSKRFQFLTPKPITSSCPTTPTTLHKEQFVSGKMSNNKKGLIERNKETNDYRNQTQNFAVLNPYVSDYQSRTNQNDQVLSRPIPRHKKSYIDNGIGTSLNCFLFWFRSAVKDNLAFESSPGWQEHTHRVL